MKRIKFCFPEIEETVAFEGLSDLELAELDDELDDELEEHWEDDEDFDGTPLPGTPFSDAFYDEDDD